MKKFILTSTFILFGITSIFAQHCVDSTTNKQKVMDCCTTKVKEPTKVQNGCCTNQNDAGASTPNGHCPTPKTIKVKAVKAAVKPKDD